MNKGILKLTTEAIKTFFRIDKDIDIMGAEFEIDRGIVKLLLTTENTAKLYKVSQAAQIPTVEFEEVTQDEYLYSKIIKEGMTYGEAQDAMHNGSCVARKVWKGYWYEEDITGFAHPVIVAKLRGTAEKVVATPYQEDRFAKDWMIVEPKQKHFDPNKTININDCKVGIEVTQSEIDKTPYAVRNLLVNLFNCQIDPQIRCEDKEKFTSRWFFYLISRDLVKVLPFTEGQIMSCTITPRGEAFLNKMRELNYHM